MKASSIVIDTSALIDATDAAHPGWAFALTRLHATHPVRAPVLLASEAGNVVHRKHPEIFGPSPVERAAFLEAILDGIDLSPQDPEARARCGAISAALRISFYDAEFVELAQREEGALLVTHDGPLLEAARRELGPHRALTLDEATRAMDLGTL